MSMEAEAESPSAAVKAAKGTMKKPPQEPIESIQYDLFSRFLVNDPDEVSNAVEYWDRIPKYFMTTAQMEKARTVDGLARPCEHDYVVNTKDKLGYTRVTHYKVEIQPAILKVELPRKCPDDPVEYEYKAFFPSKSEETIEEILRKFFTDQQYGIHDPVNLESWVRFSYNMILRELKRIGCERSYAAIRQSLEIMSKCVITVWEEDEEIYTGAILESYCRVDRKKYLDDRDAKHVARLPIFISKAINSMEYRQYNYQRLMSLDAHLSRWIFKRLINRYTNASFHNSYHMMFSDIKQGSGMLQQRRDIDNRKKVISALEDLQKYKVILSYEVEEKRRGRTIEDVKYTLTPSPEFVSEQKAAWKRIDIAHKQLDNRA